MYVHFLRHQGSMQQQILYPAIIPPHRLHCSHLFSYRLVKQGQVSITHPSSDATTICLEHQSALLLLAMGLQHMCFSCTKLERYDKSGHEAPHAC